MIRPLESGDAARCAELHARGLPDGFLVALGIPFLGAMYESLILSNEVFGFAAGPGCDGFVICTTDRRAAEKALRRRRRRLALAAAPRLLVRPALILRLARGLSYAEAPHPCAAELIAIVVDESRRSQGLGAALEAAAIGEFRRRDVGSCSVVVTAENGGARRFYERSGWRLHGVRTVFGRDMAEYVRSC